MRSRSIFAAALVLSLLAGCSGSRPQAPASQPAPAASAVPGAVNVTGAYRHDRYARGAEDLSVCVGRAAHEAHPELHFDITVGEPLTLAASRTGSSLWLIEFHDAGANLSEVVLRDRGTSQADLEEAWRMVEACSRQGS